MSDFDLHSPETCPLCAGIEQIATTPVTFTFTFRECIKHLLFKVDRIENRLQQIEWQNAPLGPGKEPEFDEERLDAIRKVLGKREPDCAICYDEGHVHVFVAPPNDDEQQCDSDCRLNWHKCQTCGKSRDELGMP